MIITVKVDRGEGLGSADQQGRGTRHVSATWTGKCDGCSKSGYWICYEASMLVAR
jgi:hypothetical protein